MIWTIWTWNKNQKPDNPLKISCNYSCQVPVPKYHRDCPACLSFRAAGSKSVEGLSNIHIHGTLPLWDACGSMGLGSRQSSTTASSMWLLFLGGLLLAMAMLWQKGLSRLVHCPLQDHARQTGYRRTNAAKQSKARQGKARQDKVSQSKAKQETNKARQSKAKPKQSKAKQSCPGNIPKAATPGDPNCVTKPESNLLCPALQC